MTLAGTRRSRGRAGASGVAGLAILFLAACRSLPAPDARPWLEAALGIADWLERVAIRTDAGLAWPAVPEESAEPERSLYAGSPGVVLFLLELSAASGDEHWLELARAGADDLLALVPERVEGESAGLYTGIAGVGFALGATWRASGDSRYRAGLERCVEVLAACAQRDAQGVAWGSVNDVIAGTAGIGFFLLRAAEELGERRARELATEAGTRLGTLAEPTEHGLDWPMQPGFARRMPNFSHGTAGIAAFLASLGEPEPLESSLAGAEHLLAIAERTDGGLRIHHHTPDGTDLYYYGWCHGPCGTARLFRALSRATGDPRWSALERACARAVTSSGLPEERLPGFWNNVSRCCGSAGVIEFMLELFDETREREYLEFARRVARDLVARGTRDERGLRWVQAEHRVRPELLQAQTGLMQGAAGIGLALLRLDGAERGRPTVIHLPDCPHGDP